jgi:hypothetical protein
MDSIGKVTQGKNCRVPSLENRIEIIHQGWRNNSMITTSNNVLTTDIQLGDLWQACFSWKLELSCWYPACSSMTTCTNSQSKTMKPKFNKAIYLTTNSKKAAQSSWVKAATKIWPWEETTIDYRLLINFRIVSSSAIIIKMRNMFKRPQIRINKFYWIQNEYALNKDLLGRKMEMADLASYSD